MLFVQQYIPYQKQMTVKLGWERTINRHWDEYGKWNQMICKEIKCNGHFLQYIYWSTRRGSSCDVFGNSLVLLLGRFLSPASYWVLCLAYLVLVLGLVGAIPVVHFLSYVKLCLENTELHSVLLNSLAFPRVSLNTLTSYTRSGTKVRYNL
jgi:hypothetical protein